MSAREVRQLVQSATQLHAAGKLDQAERIYQQVLSIRPGYADAVHLLGVVACQRGQFDRGIELISRAISISPKNSAFHNSLGNALRGNGRLAEAIPAYRRACELDPGNLEAVNNLAVSLDDMDQSVESLACFERLIAAKNDVPQWHTNRGSAQMNAGQTEAGIASFRRAVALNGSFSLAHAKLSAALLRAGQFAEGWTEAECRFSVGNIPNPAIASASPKWDGSPLAGRTLLIYSEQGYGDGFQFIRYVPLIEKAGGRVIVQCHAAAEKLLRSVNGVDEWVLSDRPLPRHDAHAAIMSLPFMLLAKTETVPDQVPYLYPDAESVAAWAHRLEPRTDSRKRVGLVWSGNPTHTNDRRRSCPPGQFASLAEMDGVDFYRLQKPCELPPPPGLKLIDHTEQLTDFNQTAALIANLDLVISVDTAVAHLTGATGKPVWVLLPFASEWRWLDKREDSPWYPTARLFRQTSQGDWSGVLKRVRAELEQYAPIPGSVPK